MTSFLYIIPLWLYASSSLSILIPILMGLIRWKFADKKLKILICYLLVFSLLDLVEWQFPRIYHESNHIVHNILWFLECIFMCIIYSMAYKTAILKSISKILLILFVIFSIINVIFFQDIGRICSNLLTVASLINIILPLLYFYQLLKSEEVISLKYLPMFWVSVGTLVYFSGSFFLALFSSDLWKDVESYILWEINLFLLIFNRIILAIGLWISKDYYDFLHSTNKISTK